MHSICKQDFSGGPFDECLKCQYLGNGCSGPRTTCMTHERYVEWLKALKKLRDYTNQEIADGTGLSLATISDIFAGRRKTIARDTAGLLEDFLIGDGKWPCAMKLVTNKEVIYEDRPETLEQLRVAREQIKEKDIQIENLRRNYNEVRDSVDREMTRVRDEYEDDIKEYRALVAYQREQLNRKDDYIDRLAKKAGI